MPTFDLTPGEALVLLDPNKKQGKEAVKVSLTWLLAKRCLSISKEHKPGFFGRFAKHSRLRPSDRLPDGLPAEMAALLQLAGKAGFMDRFVKEARFQYGYDFSRFQERYLVASLQKRGLIERRVEPLALANGMQQTLRECESGKNYRLQDIQLANGEFRN